MGPALRAAGCASDSAALSAPAPSGSLPALCREEFAVFGLRPLELLIILGVVLLFFGPKRLPGLGNALGSAIRGFKKGIGGQDEQANKNLPPGQSVSTPNAPEAQTNTTQGKA
jgi:sec-independent protein translocase protein TatA